MLIRLLLPWGRKEKGDVFDTTPSIAEVLVRRQFAEYVTEPDRLALTEVSHAVARASDSTD